jgi:hypothetical protein
VHRSGHQTPQPEQRDHRHVATQDRNGRQVHCMASLTALRRSGDVDVMNRCSLD